MDMKHFVMKGNRRKTFSFKKGNMSKITDSTIKFSFRVVRGKKDKN
jgi:hypothetical protein